MENHDLSSLLSSASDLSPLDPLNDTCGGTYVACGSTWQSSIEPGVPSGG